MTKRELLWLGAGLVCAGIAPFLPTGILCVCAFVIACFCGYRAGKNGRTWKDEE